jgi:uncharacterized protein (DUF302 family)
MLFKFFFCKFCNILINTEDYVHKIENELQDSSTYKKVEKDLTEEITKKVEKTVNKLRKKITSQMT